MPDIKMHGAQWGATTFGFLLFQSAASPVRLHKAWPTVILTRPTPYLQRAKQDDRQHVLVSSIHQEQSSRQSEPQPLRSA